MENTQQADVWSYGPFQAHHYVENKTSGARAPDRYYDYSQLTAQSNMSRVFEGFGQFFILGVVGAVTGEALAVLSAGKKIRGIFAGLAFLGGCASILYASFSLFVTIPPAVRDLPTLGGAPQFNGQIYSGSQILSTTPMAGWFLVIGAGLALAWASSDLWHIVPAKKLAPKKLEVTVTRLPTAAPPPLPSVNVASSAPLEPVIEEVFVIGSNGLLIKHMSRSLMSDKDRDVVGSMISAISSFVREAFTERDGEVHEVTLGDHRFVMCNESGLVVAVLVTTGETEDIVHRLRHLLAILRDRYGERLATWQGEPLEGIEDELGVLWEPYHLPPPPAS